MALGSRGFASMAGSLVGALLFSSSEESAVLRGLLGEEIEEVLRLRLAAGA
jgi:hypothetical protein